MTRTGDRAVPTLTPHPIPPNVPMGTWPAQLRVAIERLPAAAHTWDDDDPTVVWEGDPEPVLPVTDTSWWLDANDAATVELVPSSSEVNRWLDKSTGAMHAVRSPTGPLLTAAALNGKPGLTFAASKLLQSSFAVTITNVTVFVVSKRTGGGVGTEPSVQSVPLHFGVPSSNGFGLASRANSVNVGLLRAAIAMTSTATLSPPGACLITMQRSGSTATMWLNGTATSLSDSGSINGPSALVKVPSDVHTFYGDLYEIVVYNRVLSSTERGDVDTYLRTKWGLP